MIFLSLQRSLRRSRLSAGCLILAPALLLSGCKAKQEKPAEAAQQRNAEEVSITPALAENLKFGGNTSCVEITTPTGESLIFDAGSGIRALGQKLVQEANGAPIDTSGPTIYEALRKQLGLKLDSQKGPVDIMVIDHLEKLSEN